MPDASTVRVKTVLLIFSTLLFIINASLSASNAAKISKVSPGTVTHGFSITGSLIGIACSAGGIYLLFIEGGFTIRTYRLIWLFAALLTLFFICLGAGAWSELAQQLGKYFSSSWKGELAMEIIASFFWMARFCFSFISLLLMGGMPHLSLDFASQARGTIIIILEVEQLNLPGAGYTSIP